MSETDFASFANHPLLVATGWTLLHFVWQALVIAAAIALLLAILKRSSAQVRYLVACGGLTLMMLVPIGTLSHLLTTTQDSQWKRSELELGNSSLAGPKLEGTTGDVQVQESAFAGRSNQAAIASNSATDLRERESGTALSSASAVLKIRSLEASNSLKKWFQRLNAYLPWIVIMWCAGVFLLALRLLLGLLQVWQWRKACTPIADPGLQKLVAGLADRLQVRFPVRILESTRATVPAVVGWLKPAILLPTGLLTGLSAAELESILAHELAHVRRYDYLVNLFQSAMETLLFYHPAVWWLSGRIRVERENCCDDLAVVACGDRVVFAKALARMEELRCQPTLVMMANGAPLVDRIRRIIGAENPRSDSWWPAGVMALASLVSLAAGIWFSTTSTLNANETPNENSSVIKASAGSKGSDEGLIPVKTVAQDGGVITRISLHAIADGRSPQDLLRHWELLPGFDVQTSDSITQYESLVSARKATWIGNAVEAQQVLLNLPEGSNLHAEFHGDKVEVSQKEGVATVVITNGRLELIDSGGVIRAWASPDGGAEQLVAECREDDQEYVLSLSSRRLQPDDAYPNPPVQCVVNPNSGAPENEEQSPHGAIRYQIKADLNSGEYQLKMSWRYDVKRMVKEAEGELGDSVEILLPPKEQDSGEGWGDLAQLSGLRTRLTLVQNSLEQGNDPPTEFRQGQPIPFRFEVKNFGDKPTTVDKNQFRPLRILYAVDSKGVHAPIRWPSETKVPEAPYIADEVVLQPGESLTLWENLDVAPLFELKPGFYDFRARGGPWALHQMLKPSNEQRLLVILPKRQ